ncbi:acyl-CoA synthetase [Spongisporangium articulatum]|uniref:Acyl-CoA synthetase n=1 Tax=Spongisporangium articulatum TaxID=3362603 RepID=A0ABW8ATR4_9ACTN
MSEGFDLSTVFGTVAAAVPDREVVVQGGRRVTYAAMDARVDRLAAFLTARGLGCHTERGALAGHESGQDHVGLYLRNGPEYLEAMVGAYRARVAPVNVNYRYVEEELEFLLRDAGVTALVYHAEFAPRIAAVAPRLPRLRVLVQVADATGNRLLPGAVSYGQALAAGEAAALARPEPSPDDLYIAYTGGTTGMPKGVLWRQDDIYVSSMGGTPYGGDAPFASYDAIAANAVATAGFLRMLLITPLMHAAAQWSSFHMISGGGAIVMPPAAARFDARAALETAARERVLTIPLIGDAMARPLIDELAARRYDLGGLAAFVNGSAPLTPPVRERLLAAVPHVSVLDAVGSSETGIQLDQTSQKGAPAETAVFTAKPETSVVDDAFTRELRPGDGEGWLARRGRVPLGYLGDPEKSARTFPVIDGVRWSVPGDRARLREDGRIELLGRGSVTINSGGEKIFVEEVERALAHHPAVRDVVVVGRPSERWGSEPVALVALAPGTDVSDEELLAECARHVAGFKVPKAVVRCAELERSPSGKADYRWARTLAEEAG